MFLKKITRLSNKPTFVFLLTTYVLIATIPLIVISVTSVTFLKKIFYEQTIIANIERVRQISVSIDNIIGSIDEQASSALISNALIDIHHINYDNLNIVDNVMKVKNLERRLLDLRLYSDFIDSIYFYNIDQNLIVSCSGSSASFSEFTDTEWYEEIVESGNEKKWTGVRRNLDTRFFRELWTGKDVVSFTRATSPYLHTFRGLLIVNIDASVINKLLFEMVDPSSVEMLIINDSGLFIASNSFSSSSFQKNESLRIILTNESDGNYATISENGNDYIYYYVAGRFGWTYVLRDPLNPLLSIEKDIINLTVALVIMLVFASMIISIILSRKLYMPINHIIEYTRNVLQTSKKNKQNEFGFIEESLTQLYAESIELKGYIDSNTLAIKESCARKLLDQNIDDAQSIRSKLAFINSSMGNKYFVVLLCKFHIDQNGASTKTGIVLWHQTLNHMYRLFSDTDIISIGTIIDPDKIAVILNMNDTSELKKIANMIIKSVNDVLNSQVNIIGGGIYEDIVLVSRSYQDALNVLNYKMLLKKDSSIFFDEIDYSESESKIYPYEIETLVINSIFCGDIDEAMRQLDLFLYKSSEKNAQDKYQLENHCILLISNIIRMIDMRGSQAVDFNASGLYRDFLNKDYLLDDIKQWFRTFFLEITIKLFAEQEKYKKYENSAKNYIDDNYTNDLSLEMVANELIISYSYLRKIFNKMFGCSFPYYINMLRIDKAKELLKQTDMNGSDIAHQLGYNNEQSFYRNFKRLTGFTPIEYRRLRDK